MNGYSKEDYLFMAQRRVSAFREIARKLGKEHAITKMMGTLAWGRHKAETGPQPTLCSAVAMVAFLDGYFDALNVWARDNDSGAQRIMLENYPTGYQSRP